MENYKNYSRNELVELITRLNNENLKLKSQSETSPSGVSPSSDNFQNNEIILQQIIDVMPLAVCFVVEDSRIEYFNKKFIQLFGYTTMDTPNMDAWGEKVYPDVDYRKKVQKQWMDAVKKSHHDNSEIEPQEWIATTKHGDKRNVEFRTVVLGNKMIIVANDITILHQQQNEILKAKELAEENEFFLLESQRAANIGSYKLDFNTGIWRSSKALDTIFGIDETYDKSINGWLNLIHPEEKDKMTEYFSEEIIAKKQAFSYEYKIVRISDKQERWVHGLGALNFDSEGNLSYMVGTIQDVTRLHQQQDEILKAKEIAEENANLYRKMNENSPLGMHFYKFENGQLIFTGANPVANKILNVDNQQFIGKTIEEAFPPLAQTEIPLRYSDTATKGIYWTTEQIIYDDNRIAGAYEVRAFQTSPNNMVAIFDDITPRKQAEQELVKLNNELEHRVQEKTKDLEKKNDELITKNKIINAQNEELKATLQNLQETQTQLLQSEKMASLGILTAGVAHEINNPLNYIMGSYVGLLRYYNENCLAENHEQVGMLINALKIGIDRSTAIIKGLNQFSRKSESLDEDCNIHAIIDNSLTMLYTQIKHNITVDKEYFASDIIIKGNVGNLHQVFINILANAVQAIESKGTITIKTESEASNVIIKITDTGSGIPTENLKKITDPFFTTKDPGKGTGLGLSITYNIIKDHKGKIEFESKEGKGTTVKITLPKA